MCLYCIVNKNKTNIYIILTIYFLFRPYNIRNNTDSIILQS